MHSFSPLVATVLTDDRLATARRHELRSSAARTPVKRTPPQTPAVTIRRAREQDAVALRRLAELDSAAPLTAPVLVAEADGAILAAISLADGATIADPFTLTAGIRDLLETRAGQLAAAPATGRRH